MSMSVKIKGKWGMGPCKRVPLGNERRSNGKKRIPGRPMEENMEATWWVLVVEPE
jgi:hypothetical protein